MAASMSVYRVRKEFAECTSGKEGGISAELVGDDLRHWKGQISGPEGTPYSGGTFVVDIQIPANYPFVPPKMRFDTKVWHPNVSSANGAICLDILKDQWSPALTMRTAMLSLQALLSCPNPDDPQDAQVAGQYKKDRTAFEKTARHWTDTWAKAKKKDTNDAKVEKLVAMGFSREKCEAALKKANYDENRAIDVLFG